MTCAAIAREAASSRSPNRQASTSALIDEDEVTKLSQNAHAWERYETSHLVLGDVRYLRNRQSCATLRGEVARRRQDSIDALIIGSLGEVRKLQPPSARWSGACNPRPHPELGKHFSTTPESDTSPGTVTSLVWRRACALLMPRVRGTRT